jgi:RimJ/RimL family protein N-acetyltransferase
MDPRDGTPRDMAVVSLAMSDEIAAQRLVLRSLRASDAERVHAYRANPDVARYQSWDTQSLDEVRAFIEAEGTLNCAEPGWHQLAIAERSTDHIVGDLGVHILESDLRQVELGFTLAPDAQRQGYATEAVRAILDHLFAAHGKHRVIASTDPRNERSIALLRRVGFRLEAHHRDSLWFKGAWVDDMIFALLRREWPSS